MFGRVYFGAHWIGDTLAGYMIGMLITQNFTPIVFRSTEYLFGNSLPSVLFH